MLLVLGIATPAFAETKRDPIDLIYVASRVSGEIAMIDSRDDRVVGHVTLAHVPDQFVLSETHRLLIAAHVDAQSLSLFDLESMQPRAELALGFPPDQIQLDDTSGMVAVAGSKEGKLALIALESSAIVGRIEGLADPSDLIFDRTGERLFVASGSDAWIDIVDIAAGRVAGRIDLDADGQGVIDLVRTPGGRSGLALHGASGLISGLNLIEAEQVERTQLPGPADRAFPAANSQFFLIPNGHDQSISTVSSWTYRDYERVAAGADVSGISFGMFDTVAIALDADANRALAFSLMDERPTVIAIDLPGRPETSLSVEAGTKLYVALGDTDQIAVLDMTQPRLMGTIDDVIDQPWAVNAAGGLGYCH